MTSVEPVVSIRNLSKTFYVEGKGETARLSLAPVRLARQFLRLLFSSGAASRWAHSVAALKDVSLDVMPGEMIGIIGDNGAGKTTLLRILAGVLRPSSGSVTVRGRIASLIDLGGEFSKEMTIAENVTMACALAGMSSAQGRDAKARILEWADLDTDEETVLGRCTPGQLARLAFATAMVGEPEVILADEVLTVGDGDFRRECEARIARAGHLDGAVLFVSHDLEAIKRTCTRVVWLEAGSIRAIGPPDYIVDEYIRATVPPEAGVEFQSAPPPASPAAVCAIAGLRLYSTHGEADQYITSTRDSILECELELDATRTTFSLSLDVSQDGRILATLAPPRPFSIPGKTTLKVSMRIPPNFFAPGAFSVLASLQSPKGWGPDVRWKVQDARKYRVYVMEGDVSAPLSAVGDLDGGVGRYSIGARSVEPQDASLRAEAAE